MAGLAPLDFFYRKDEDWARVADRTVPIGLLALVSTMPPVHEVTK